MKRILLVVGLMLLGRTASAAPPLGWPGDTWPCTSPATGWCLRLQANGASTIALRLEGIGPSGGGYASSDSGVAFRTVSTSGTPLTAFSQSGRGFEVTSQLNDGVYAQTQVGTRSSVVARQLAGATFPGFWTDGVNWSYAYNIHSDPDYKHLRGANPYGLAAVLKLKPASYVLRGDPTNTRVVGLYADEVEAAMPSAVRVGPNEPDGPDDLDGKPLWKGAKGKKGIDLYQLNVAAIAAIQELEARVKALEANVHP
jgi:hypothetical protein